MQALKVECRLSAPIAGEVPKLDALVTLRCAHAHPRQVPRGQPVPRELLGKIPIPITLQLVDWMPIPRCSSPIFAEPATDQHDHFHRSMANEDFSITDEKKILVTTSGALRSYRLPLRTRLIESVVWFCFGERAGLSRILEKVTALGKKASIGYGRVQSWQVEPCEQDYSWYAPSSAGTVLMRPLPADVPDRPADLTGYREWFGGVLPPYWQKDLFVESIEPC